MRKTKQILLAVLVLLTLALAGCGEGSSSDADSSSASGSESVSDPVEVVEPVEFPWYLTLVNRDNPLPVDFQPPELSMIRSEKYLDSRAYPDLEAMLEAAQEEDLYPLVCSAFRAREYQETLFQEEIQRHLDRGLSQEEAEAEAAMWVAVPGTSEHELGLAVDIVDLDYQMLDEEQEQTEVQQWLMAHCAEYGFILRYPTDRSDVTGIDYEPWHYRYVGRAAAAEIMGRNLCLEEYLEQITSQDQIPEGPEEAPEDVEGEQPPEGAGPAEEGASSEG